MRKGLTLAACAVFGLFLARPASADLVTFDPSGTAGSTGDITNVAIMDIAPGDALAVGASAGSTVGSNFTLLYQANLAAMQDVNTNNLFSNGTDGFHFTIVLGFQETITGNTNVGGSNTALTFGYSALNDQAVSTNASDPNFFFLYAVPDNGDYLSGTGFVPGAAGAPNPILSGYVINSTDYSSNFVATGQGGALDNSPNGNNYPGFATILGSGSSVLQIQLATVNSLYFPTLAAGSSLFLANTSQLLPFNQVDPSACFTQTGLPGSACFGGATLASIGALNGLSGPNTILQVDGNGSFLTPSAAVPEPATLTLLGLGLFGSASLRRRQLKNKHAK